MSGIKDKSHMIELLRMAPEEMPEQRLGQLLVNATGATCPRLFSMSDEKMVELLQNIVTTGNFDWGLR